METIFTATVQYQTQHCFNCGMYFAMTKHFFDRRLKDHETFYCPAGHPQHYTGKSQEQKLKEQLRREKLERESAESRADNAWKEAEKAIRSQRVTKGHHTRLKNQIAGGQCPCCKKTFKVLAKHMKKSHPDYEETVE